MTEIHNMPPPALALLVEAQQQAIEFLAGNLLAAGRIDRYTYTGTVCVLREAEQHAAALAAVSGQPDLCPACALERALATANGRNRG